MLKLMEVEVQLPIGEKTNNSIGSLMHGILMENISIKVANLLHEEGLRPFSQCIYFDKEKNKSMWRIGTLTKEIYEIISSVIYEKENFFLKQKGYNIFLKNPRILFETSYEKIADEIFPNSDEPKGANFNFLTTTSFKRNSEYVIFPDQFLIMHNLLQRWNTFSPYMKIDDNNLAGKLASVCKITKYNLHSRIFSLESKNIIGFGGNISINFIGNDMVNRIIAVLSNFASFAGVGIKTALGMGAVNTEIFWRCKNDFIQSIRNDRSDS